MPRRNKRKDYTIGKAAVFFKDGDNAGYNPECVGCAFAGYDGTCKTSDGSCLKTASGRREPDNNAACKR